MSFKTISALFFVCLSVLFMAAPTFCQAAADDYLLYVCNEGSGNISIIDPDTNTTVGSIDRPSIPAGMAMSPDGARLYVTGKYSNSVSIIDTASDSLTNTMGIDSGLDRGLDFSPYISVSPDGKSLCAMDDFGYWIKVLNASTFNMTSVSATRARSYGAAFSRDGRTLYLAGGNSIYAIDADTGKVSGSISFLGYPIGVSVSRDGEHIYSAVISKSSFDRLYPSDCPTCTCCLYPGLLAQMVSGLAQGRGTPGTNDINAIYEINARSLSVEATIPLENAPRAYTAGPGDIVYAACNGPYSNYLYAINVTEKSVTDRILVAQPLSRSFWSMPGLIAASPDGSYVYIAEGMDKTLLIVDMRDHNVSEIELGANPASIAAGLSKAYVSAGQVLVIDPVNRSIARSLNYWWDPQNIVFSPDRTMAYVTTRWYAAGEGVNMVTVIDTQEGRILSDIDLNCSPGALAISPDGSKLSVVDPDKDIVSMINPVNGTVGRTIRVGHYPDGLAFSPDGATLYVVCQEPALMAIEPSTGSVINVGTPANDSLYAIDAATGDIYWTMDVRYFPAGIAVSPDGGRLYVACKNETSDRTGSIRVIDAHDRTVVRSIQVHGDPVGIRISPDGSRLYVIYNLNNKLTVIDTGTGAAIADIGLEYSMMKYMEMSPDGSWLYLSTGGFTETDIEVIDTRNNTVAGMIKAGFSPAGMAIKTG